MTRIINLAIVGCFTNSNLYPNVYNFIRTAKSDSRFNIISFINFQEESVHYAKGGKVTHKLMQAAKLLYCSLKTAYCLKKLLTKKEVDVVYVPYPGFFALFFLNFLWFGKRRRPKLYLDAFISLYDTIVHDRKLLNKNNLLAKVLLKLETISYKFSDKVIVDTVSNKKYLCKLFQLPEQKIIVSPLFIDESIYCYQPYKNNAGILKVLFFGSFVPLHGVEAILIAAKTLTLDHRFTFQLIGKGQTSEKLQHQIAKLSNVNWENRWVEPEELYQYIAQSDVCLGVFGKTEKAQRVWPFKNYLAMSVGRCIVSIKPKPGVLNGIDIKHDVYASVEQSEGKLLADVLTMLADNSDMVVEYAKRSRRYYIDNLSNSRSIELLYQDIVS